MLAPRPSLRVVTRSRYRRLVPVVRALRARRWNVTAIAGRLGMSRRNVRRALSEGAGLWSPADLSRMRAALRDFQAEGNGR